MIYWRVGLVIALVAASVRTGGLGHDMSNPLGYALQFGPLLLLAVAQATQWVLTHGWRTTPRKVLRVVVPATGLVIVAMLSTLWATDRTQTLLQAGIFASVFFFAISTYVCRWTRAGFLDADLRTVFWTGIAVHGVGIIGFALGQEWAIGPYGRLIGVTPNANYPGISGAALLVLGYYFSGRRFRIASLVPATSIFLSDTRGSMVASVAGLLVIVIVAPTMRNLRDRTWAIFTILGLPLLFVFRWMNLFALLPSRSTYDTAGGTVPPPPSSQDLSSGRLDIYREYLNIWMNRPWLGTGYRSPQATIGGAQFEAHNVYLSVLSELGVLGMVVFVSLLIGMFFSAARRSALLGAAVAILALEATESSLFGFGGPTALASWMILIGWAATGLQVADDRGDAHPT